jgi:hypothetical protein
LRTKEPLSEKAASGIIRNNTSVWKQWIRRCKYRWMRKRHRKEIAAMLRKKTDGSEEAVTMKKLKIEKTKEKNFEKEKALWLTTVTPREDTWSDADITEEWRELIWDAVAKSKGDELRNMKSLLRPMVKPLPFKWHERLARQKAHKDEIVRIGMEWYRYSCFWHILKEETLKGRAVERQYLATF